MNNRFPFDNIGSEKSLYSFSREETGASFLYRLAILERDVINSVYFGGVERVPELQKQFENLSQKKDEPLESIKELLSRLLFSAGLAAIRAGLDSTLVYLLLDKCKKQISLVSTRESLVFSFSSAINELCNRVQLMEAPTFEDSSITAIARYIDANCTGGITLADVADYSGYSREHLCRRFKEVTKKTVTQYIRESRVYLACRILKTTSLNVAEISDYLSFHSQSYFQRVFKEVTGMTPNEFRSKGVF